MNKIITILCLFLSFNLSAQTNYDNLTDWQAAIDADANLDDCAQENFSSATGPFHTVPIQLNGFTLEQSSGTRTFRNLIGLNDARMFVEKDEPVEVKLTFTQPGAAGFIADFENVAVSPEMLRLVYDSGAGMLDSFDFTNTIFVPGTPVTFGFLNPQNIPINSIVFKAINASGTQGGQPFTMSNVRIACRLPQVSIAATSQAAEDGKDGLFTITTDMQFATPTFINLSIAGTAADGIDYTTIPPFIEFPANSNTVTIPVEVIGDLDIEGPENVTLTIEPEFVGKSGVPPYNVGTPSSATVSISDNDFPIPTMSQWGLMIFGLLILNLGVVFVQRKELA